jgi:hypothetical protein
MLVRVPVNVVSAVVVAAEAIGLGGCLKQAHVIVPRWKPIRVINDLVFPPKQVWTVRLGDFGQNIITNTKRARQESVRLFRNLFSRTAQGPNNTQNKNMIHN